MTLLFEHLLSGQKNRERLFVNPVWWCSLKGRKVLREQLSCIIFFFSGDTKTARHPHTNSINETTRNDVGTNKATLTSGQRAAWVFHARGQRQYLFLANIYMNRVGTSVGHRGENMNMRGIVAAKLQR